MQERRSLCVAIELVPAERARRRAAAGPHGPARDGSVPRLSAHEALRRRSAACVAVAADAGGARRSRPCGSAAATSRSTWTRSPRREGLIEVLALTHVFEHRVVSSFHASELRQPGLPDAVRRTFGVLLQGRSRVIWTGLARWLADAAGIGRRSWRGIAAPTSAWFNGWRRIGERLWDVSGLGEELGEGSDGEIPIAEEERHPAQSQHPA